MARHDKTANMATTDEMISVVVNVPRTVRKPAKVALSTEDARAGKVANVTIAVDMSKVTADAILDAALRTVVIATQGRIRATLRKEGGSVQSIEGRTFHAEIAPQARTTVDPVARARMALSGLSPEQRAELLAALGE